MSNNGGDGGQQPEIVASAPAPQQQPLFSRQKLHEFVGLISMGEKLDPPLENALVKLTESFVMELSSSAAELAKHRKSNTLEVKDIQLYLEREWNMSVPGFVDVEDKKIYNRGHPTIAHQTRSAHATRAASNAAYSSAIQQSNINLPRGS